MVKFSMKSSTQEVFSKAVKLREDGEPQAAIELLEKLTGFDSETAIVFATLGHAYWDIQKLPQACAAFRKAIELDPYSEVYSLGYFHCLWLQQKRYEALKETERFMKLSDSVDYRKIVSEINDGAS